MINIRRGWLIFAVTWTLYWARLFLLTTKALTIGLVVDVISLLITTLGIWLYALGVRARPKAFWNAFSLLAAAELALLIFERASSGLEIATGANGLIIFTDLVDFGMRAIGLWALIQLPGGGEGRPAPNSRIT